MDYGFLTKNKTEDNETANKIDYSFLAPDLKIEEKKPEMVDKTPDRKKIESDLGIKQGVGANLGSGIKKVFSDVATKAKSGLREVKQEVFKPQEQRDKEEAVKAALGILGNYAKEKELEKMKNGTSTVTPEDLASVAKKSEHEEEAYAKVITAPIRWTAGSLATAMTSLGLQKVKAETGKSSEYDPKTDVEKLIIGENKIKPILEQDDLYGTLARGAGVPAAMGLMVLFENPFLAGTGVKTAVKKYLEKKISQEAGERVAKIGMEELHNLAENAIQEEVKAGKLAKDEGIAVIDKYYQAVNIPKLEAPKEKVSYGEGFTMKDSADKKQVEKGLAIADYNKKVSAYIKNPTAKNAALAKVAKDKKDALILAEQKKVTPVAEVVPSATKDIKTPVAEVVPSATKDIKTPVAEVVPTATAKVVSPKITVEPGMPAVPTRIKNEAIEKGLIANFGGIEGYEKVSFADQAKLVGEIIDEDPEKAIRIALGEELPTNGALPESVFIAVKNQALDKNNTELLVKLATAEKGVARESTRLGQRIKMLDEQLEDDAFTNIKKVVKNREAKVKGSGELMKKEKTKIKEFVKKETPKKDEWLSFVDSLKCPK